VSFAKQSIVLPWQIWRPKLMRKFVIVMVTAVLWTGAVTAQDEPVRPFPPMTFSGSDLLFDAAALFVSSTFEPSLTPPHVEHLAPVSPEAALRQWASDKLAVTGTGTSTIELAIGEAVLLEEPLNVTEGVSGWFRKDQAAKYTARLAATLRINQANGASASASASVWRSTTVEEDTELADLEIVWFRLIEQVVNDFQASLEPQVRSQMAGYLPEPN